MKRLKSIKRILCLAAAASLVGQLVHAGAYCPAPAGAATRVASQLASPPGKSDLPPEPGSTCSAAERCGVHFMLKESRRVNPSSIIPKLGERVLQSPRASLRVPSRASGSQVLWVETCTSSLNALHVRMQI